MAVYGYARVSTGKQHVCQHLDARNSAGLSDSLIFLDVINGSSVHLPGLLDPF